MRHRAHLGAGRSLSLIHGARLLGQRSRVRLAMASLESLEFELLGPNHVQKPVLWCCKHISGHVLARQRGEIAPERTYDLCLLLCFQLLMKLAQARGPNVVRVPCA